MSPQLILVSDKITILGGGAVNHSDLARALDLAPSLVAADGGADIALAAGHMPDAVIGDFDSISAAARAAIPKDRQFPVAEQDSTDFEKCLRSVEARLILGVGFLGDRFDHALAALNTLVRYPHKRTILIGDDDICFVCPRQLDLDLPAGTRFSLFPMAHVAGQSGGLRWPIDGIAFAPGGRIGTSNEVTGPVRLTMDGPGMAVLLPVEFLTPVAEALMAVEVAGG
ncbi:Thiamin pyrophosphokinase [Rhodovulum sp. P5]|uniref:thiamine diphosphokinase n=1 Tax=Rhodovulum sp. P5 TaxID=1564506 RepID=UPI0009C3B0AB|nr:thiamine diphosphokinase [Rhodovulum sp. P5]ARE39359.1 Thiamin pyrophosphokinase [Rhodovulum sp. P5]